MERYLERKIQKIKSGSDEYEEVTSAFFLKNIQLINDFICFLL